jgi:hypothetical protein
MDWSSAARIAGMSRTAVSRVTKTLQAGASTSGNGTTSTAATL